MNRLLAQQLREAALASTDGQPDFDRLCALVSEYYDAVEVQIARDVNEQHTAAQNLRESEQRLRLALAAAGMGTWVWNIHNGELTWSERVIELFATAGDGLGATIERYFETVHSDDRIDVERELTQVLSSGAADYSSEHRVVLGDGRIRWLELFGRIHRGVDGSALRMIGTVTDVTRRKHAELALCEEKERALVTLQSIGDAVVTTDEHGLVESMNPVAEQRLGLSLHSVQGKLIDQLFEILCDDSGETVENPVLQCLLEDRVIEAKTGRALRSSGGSEFAIQLSAAPIRDTRGAVIGAVMVFHDASMERSLYQRLSYQARHDALTGLINRRELEDRLSEAIRDSWSTGQQHCLLYLDVDQFKVVNDTCGHTAGDELLKRVAEILSRHVRASDHLARLGGDEFCIMLSDCPQEQGEKIAEAVRAAVNDFRFIWHDRTFGVSVSIGLVRIDARSENIASVLSAADVACYAAKDAGRNRVNVYRGEAELIQHREMQWVSRITQACEDDRLVLFSHPIVSLDRGEPRRHFELLLRMRDPYGKLVPPNSFIPAAERYSLMPVIDRWVVKHTLTQLAQRAGDDVTRPYTLSVNLSGSSLSDPSFLDLLRCELQRCSVAPGAICFEITETAAISNLEQAVHFMRELRKLGCWFALDDFGSGLSSFAYLKDLPVEFLKIDRHFVKNVITDVVDNSMVAAINQVGHVMGLKTVAEGVETRAVLDNVRAAGLDFAQGFLFGQPGEVSGRDDFLPREMGEVIPMVV